LAINAASLEYIMTHRQFSRFWTRWIGWLVVPLAVVLSRWVKRHAREKWETLILGPEIGGPSSLGSTLENVYRPNKPKSLEKLYYQGSSDDSIGHHGPPIMLPRWAREIQPFLLNQLSVHTRRAYETDLKQFFAFMEGRINALNLTSLRSEHVILYRKYLEEGRLTGRPMEKSTINRKLAVIKSFLNWLKSNHVIADNPAQLVKGYPQTQESSLKGLSDEEARKILVLPKLNSRSGSLHAGILTTLLYMGLRKGELIALKMGDLDVERGVPVLKVRGKGHRVRILPLIPLVKDRLEHYFFVCRRDRSESEAPLFIPTKNPRTGTTKKPLNPNAITYIVSRYARKAGILKPISPHSCRATCISNALDRKATHRSVQHLAGWSTPLMIQRYDKRREDLKNSAAFLIDYDEVTTTAVGSA
jgi:integrase/recombinase XerD